MSDEKETVVSWKSYWKPTPKNFRKLGDAVLAFGTTLTVTFATMEVSKHWIIASALATALGKAMTNFFTDEDK